MAAVNFPDPSASPWTNPDNNVTYVYNNGVWSVQSVGGGDNGGGGDGNDPNAVKLNDGGIKQVIESAGLGLSNGNTENITLNSDGSANFGANANWAGGYINIRKADNNWAQMISIDSTSSSPTGLFIGCGANTPTGQALLIARSHTSLGGSSTVNSVQVDWNGNVTLTGAVQATSFNLESLQPLQP